MDHSRKKIKKLVKNEDGSYGIESESFSSIDSKNSVNSGNIKFEFKKKSKESNLILKKTEKFIFQKTL